MEMPAFILALALSFSGDESDGGPDTDRPVHSVLDVVDGELFVRDGDGGMLMARVKEGCWLDTLTCTEAGKRKAEHEAITRSWNSGWIRWVGLSFGAGVTVGAVVGIILGLVLWK